MDAAAVSMTRVPPWFEDKVAQRRPFPLFVIEQSCFGPMCDATPELPFHHFGTRLDQQPLNMGWQLDGRKCTTSLPVGTVSIIPAGASGKVWWDRPVDFACLYFTPAALTEALGARPAAGELSVAAAIGQSSPTLSFLLRALHADMQAGSPCGTLVGESIFASFAAVLAGIVHGTPRKSGNAPIDWRIRRATDYIHAHLHEPLSLATIAEAAATSAFHLSRSFCASMGCTIWQYVTRERVGAAKLLMQREPTMTLAQVALDAGFESYSAFITAFKASCGTTPSQYRRARWSA